MDPKVSVVMSVHNGQRYLGEAIESILGQTFTDFEFIIINDGSTDRSVDIVQSYDDPRICYFENEQNIGLTLSLNRGLSLARGQYIARMDADDISLPERLRKQVDFLDAHPEVGVLACAVRFIDARGNTLFVRRYPAEHNFLRWQLCFRSPFLHPMVVMRRDVLERAGGYNPDFVTAQDYDLWQRLSGMTRLSSLPDVLFCMRKHKASVEGRHYAEQQENGMEISRRMMSEVLGKEVPIDAVQHLWRQDLKTAYDVRLCAKLVKELCQAFLADRTVSAAEKRVLRRDAARRLWWLVRSRVWHPSAWPVVISSCRLDPLAIGMEEARRLWYPVRKRVFADWVRRGASRRGGR